MTEPMTPTAGPTGPDLTPSKSLPDPIPSHVGGESIANCMILFGVVMSLIGAGLWGSNLDSYDSVATAMFGASMGQLGVLTAILGVHALAIRYRRP